MSPLAYLSLGSNLGDRADHLRQAIARLAALGQVVAVSSFYETEPVEVTSQPWFLNCVVALDTALTPEALLDAALAIEQSMGRRRTQFKGPRTIDIDILLIDDAIIHNHRLTLPHPALHERRFVLEPLAELAPALRHPTLQLTVRELLDRLPPGQAVRKLASVPLASHKIKFE